MLYIKEKELSYESGNYEYQSGNSRYQILRVINSDDGRYLETQNQKFIPTSTEDSYHIVGPREVNRLDIISNMYYGTPVYWWAIALANEYVDPFVVPQGVMVRVPSLLTISDKDNEILSLRRRI